MFKRVWNWIYDRPVTLAISLLLVLALVTCAATARADRIDDMENMTPFVACQVRAQLLHVGMSVRNDKGPDYTIPEFVEFQQTEKEKAFPDWVRYNERELEYITAHFQQGWDLADKYMEIMGEDKLSKAFHQEKTDKFFEACMAYVGVQPEPTPERRMKFTKVQGQHMGTEYTYEGLFNRTMGCVAHNMPIYFETCMQKAVDGCVAENHEGVFSESQSGQLIMDCKRMVSASDVPIMCKDRAKDRAFKCLNLFPPVEDYGVDCEGLELEEGK